MNKKLLQTLACLFCSPLIFGAMYFDYYYKITYFYFIAIVVPFIFIRNYKHLIIVFILSCVISILLVNMYIPKTETFFKPFGQILALLVVMEAILFGLVQLLFLLIIKFFRKARKKQKL
jgi:hypothetical protein